MNDTILNFGYPNTLLKEYDNWVLLLRSEQITLGSMVLAYKEDVENFSEVSKEGFVELKIIASEIEKIFKVDFKMKKINYLALMMVDKNVHYHVIPRYSEDIVFKNLTFKDNGWPKLPEFSKPNKLDSFQFDIIKDSLKTLFK